jgi:glycosyltransferase involved in cell wall biosynthesis
MRVLMISYYFPPQGGIASVRALKFATHLPAFGWDPIVIAPREGSYDEDSSLSFSGISVLTSNVHPGRLFGGVPRGGRSSSGESSHGAVVGRVVNKLRSWLYQPDGQIGWYPFALTAARRVIRRNRCDAIFSSSPPITAHLVARRLRRETQRPWVAEFRDLWTPWGDLWTPWPSQTGSRQRRDEVLERSILEEASEVVTVSPGSADFLRSRGARRVSIVTNGFDPEDYSELTPRDGTTVTYLGTYYPDRQDLGTALRALGGLASAGALASFRLRFVGRMPTGLDRVIAESGLEKFVECTGFVPHKEGLRYLSGSTLVLLAGPVSAGNEALRGNIPGKTFEYLGSRRPILFVGDSHSDVADLLRPFPNVRIVPPGDVDGARAAVLSLLGEDDLADHSVFQRFASGSVAGDLAAVLSRASGGTGS